MEKRERPPQPTLGPRIAAAERQVRAMPHGHQILYGLDEPMPKGRRLARLLMHVACHLGCAVAELRLDHDPALRTRAYNKRKKDVAARYTPHAHDPEHLRYRSDHDIKTYVRGDHGQLSDIMLINRERRRDRASVSKPKVRLPKRKLQNRSAWPAKGSRKIRSRGFR